MLFLICHEEASDESMKKNHGKLHPNTQNLYNSVQYAMVFA